jgi:hypothetical protein
LRVGLFTSDPKGAWQVRYIEALTEYESAGPPAVFLGGGITGCPDWQRELVTLLADETVTLLNPRRTHFPITNRIAAPQQIEWEFRHLRKADAVLFWFPCETLCPIALYELGAWSVLRDERGLRPLFVGIHPQYERRLDVEIQTRLVRPEVAVVYSLADMAASVKRWIVERRGNHGY